MKITPIGTFHCDAQYPYDAARQGAVAGDNIGRIELVGGQNFEQALQDLEGFSHIWIVYQFHKNENWKPLVNPPRGGKKVGVFASRAPYRPNAIGLSCVQLVKVEGRTVTVAGHDLLDGTPVLDIKPYLPYADAVPEATSGWLETATEAPWTVTFTDDAQKQLDWLADNGVDCLQDFLVQQLSDEPFNHKRKRIEQLDHTHWEIAYRTWRVKLKVEEAKHQLEVQAIYSGYCDAELAEDEDKYRDKVVHRGFGALIS